MWDEHTCCSGGGGLSVGWPGPPSPGVGWLWPRNRFQATPSAFLLFVLLLRKTSPAIGVMVLVKHLLPIHDQTILSDLTSQLSTLISKEKLSKWSGNMLERQDGGSLQLLTWSSHPTLRLGATARLNIAPSPAWLTGRAIFSVSKIITSETRHRFERLLTEQKLQPRFAPNQSSSDSDIGENEWDMRHKCDIILTEADIGHLAHSWWHNFAIGEFPLGIGIPFHLFKECCTKMQLQV